MYRTGARAFLPTFVAVVLTAGALSFPAQGAAATGVAAAVRFNVTDPPEPAELAARKIPGEAASTSLGGVEAIQAPARARQLVRAAAAGQSVIRFDEYPVGTSITTNYANRGVVFASSNTTSSPFISNDDSNPTAPVLSGYPQFSGDIIGWFVIPGTNTPTTVPSLTVDVGYIDSPGSIQLVAYTSTGADVITADKTGINTLTSNVGSIFAFEVLQNADEPAGFAIDNLTFTPGTTVVPGLAGGAPEASESNGGSNPGSTLTVCGVRLCGDPVNTLTGNLTETFTDVTVQGAGPSLNLERTYNSLDADDQGWFGRGWRSTWEASVVVANATATVTFGNGSTVAYTKTPIGWVAPPRVTAQLRTFDAGNAQVELADGTVLHFDADGSLSSVSDINGRAVNLERPNANTVKVTDRANRNVTLTFAAGRVVSVTDPHGSVTSYTYKGEDLASVTTPLGGVTAFEYNTSHQLAKQTNPEGGTSTHTYSSGRVAKQIDARGGTWAYSYRSDGTTVVTYPDGTKTEHRYVDGVLTRATSAAGTAQAATWRYEYDPVTGGRTKETLPDGSTLTRQFDARGNVTSQTDAEGRTHSFTYDDLGHRTSVTYPSGRLDIAQYDSAGNLYRITEDAGSQALTTQYERGSFGDLVRAISPSGAVTEFATDAAGLITSVTDPDGVQLTLGYDDLGRETSRTQAAADVADNRTLTRTWDKESNLVKVTDPQGEVTSFRFDDAGRETSRTDARGNTTTTSYNGAGDVTKVVTADGLITRFTVDEVGKVTRRTDPNGTVSKYGYDRLGRLVSETDQRGRITRRTFDAAGRVRTSTSPDGTRVTYSYDRTGLPTRTTYSDATPSVTYTYAADGQRATMTDGVGTSTYAYDTAGRLISQNNSAGSSVAYDLDRDGNPTTTTYSNGQRVTNSYSPGGRLTSVTDWLGNTTRFGIDAFGQTSSIQYGNGVTGTWAFDKDGRPTSVGYTGPQAGALRSFRAERGAGGLVDELSGGVTDVTTSFGYNKRNQLNAANDTPVTYDFAANLLKRPDGATQTHDVASQLTTTVAAGARDPGAATYSVKSSKYAGQRAASLALGRVGVAKGQRLFVLTSSGRAVASRTVGAPLPSAAGLTFKRVGTKSGSAGRTDVWMATATKKVRPNVTVKLGARHGTVYAIALTVTGGAPATFVPAAGKASAASFLVTTMPGDLVLASVAAVTSKPMALQAATGSKLLGGASDRSRRFAAAATRTGPLKTSAAVRVGSKTKAQQWVAGAIRIPARSAAGVTRFGYSSDGERVVQATASKATRYRYDAEHRLTRVTEDSVVTGSYRYDGDGLRVTSRVGTTRTFTYQPGVQAANLLSDGETSFIYGPGNLPVAQIRGDEVTYLLADTQGSVRAMTDRTGAAVGSQDFSATGVRTASGKPTPLGFHGQYTDPTGLQHLRARYYDPKTAAFLTKDPMTRNTGSPYGFAGGNPIAFADPSGLVFVSCDAILEGVKNLGDSADAAIQGLDKGTAVRATLLGKALRTSPSAAVRSYAGAHLRAAGNALRSPTLSVLSKVAKGLPLVGAGLTYGIHVLDGDSQQEAVGAGVGALAGGYAGGAAGAALGGAACGALAGTTFGLGAATCPVLIGGGTLIGGGVGSWIGENVGGWVGGWFD